MRQEKGRRSNRRLVGWMMFLFQWWEKTGPEFLLDFSPRANPQKHSSCPLHSRVCVVHPSRRAWTDQIFPRLRANGKRELRLRREEYLSSGIGPFLEVSHPDWSRGVGIGQSSMRDGITFLPVREPVHSFEPMRSLEKKRGPMTSR